MWIKQANAAQLCKATGNMTLIAVRDINCPKDFFPTRIASYNIFDAWWNYGKMKSAANDLTTGSIDALVSANASGVRVFRFFASYWGNADISYKNKWYQNKANYWRKFDLFMDVIDRFNFKIIPSIGYVLATLVKENYNDLVLNTSSQSYNLTVTYFTEFVKRYRNRTSILFWELDNELNYLVDLSSINSKKACGISTCFNTDQMVSFNTRLQSLIHNLDPLGRPVSSGFGAPRF